MKRIVFFLVIFFSLIFYPEAKPHKYRAAVGIFYSHLAPHGIWMEFNDGIIVWRPSIVKKSWAPYKLGRWIYTDYGWYWDSYEPFGYITYHYGRWYFDDFYGWIWIPDLDWAPAWVEWRYDNDYIGWAPLPPYAAFSINVGLYLTFNYVTPYTHWHFVSYDYLCDPYVYNYYVPPKYKYKIYSNTKYRNEYTYSEGKMINKGVDVNDIRIRSGQVIRQRKIQQVSNPREVVGKYKEVKDNIVRTFVASSDEYIRGNSRDNFDIRKIERKSKFETSHWQIDNMDNGNKNFEFRDRSDDEGIKEKVRELRDYKTETQRKKLYEVNDLMIRREEKRSDEIIMNRERIMNEQERKRNRLNERQGNNNFSIEFEKDKQRIKTNDDLNRNKILGNDQIGKSSYNSRGYEVEQRDNKNLMGHDFQLREEKKNREERNNLDRNRNR